MIFNVVKNALVPADIEAPDRLAPLTVGERVEVHIPHARNQAFANFINMVFNRLAEAREWSPRTMRGLICILVGRCDIVVHNDAAYVIPHGTGPRDMNQATFEIFAEDAIERIRTDFVPQLNDYDAADIMGLIEGPRR